MRYRKITEPSHKGYGLSVRGGALAEGMEAPFCQWLLLLASCGVARCPEGRLGQDASMDTDEPGPPECLEVVSSTSTSLGLSWSPPGGPNGDVGGYLVTLGPREHVTSVTSVVVSGLQPDTAYNVTLKAFNGAGWGQRTWIMAKTRPERLGLEVGLGVGIPLAAAALASALFCRRRLLEALRNRRDSSRSRSVGSSALRQADSADGEVKKCDLWPFIRNLEDDTQRGLEEEFGLVTCQSPKYSTVAATRPLNKDKNRFRNVLPYDQSRVELPLLEGEADSDYINASYIKDIDGRPYFVASQGPKPNTVRDFWRMVWELRIGAIVMLTSLVERGRAKCARYWPSSFGGSATSCDGFLLRLQAEEEEEEEKEGHCVTRTVEVTKGCETRTVRQYHFTAWPDFGVPSCEDLLLGFISSVRRSAPASGGHLLVHCSAGVGRTGTFIGLWNLMDALDADGGAPTVNVRRAVLAMRESRPSMVQSQEQYLYLYKCVAAYLQATGTKHVYENFGYEGPI